MMGIKAGQVWSNHSHGYVDLYQVLGTEGNIVRVVEIDSEFNGSSFDFTGIESAFRIKDFLNACVFEFEKESGLDKLSFAWIRGLNGGNENPLTPPACGQGMFTPKKTIASICAEFSEFKETRAKNTCTCDILTLMQKGCTEHE